MWCGDVYGGDHERDLHGGGWRDRRFRDEVACDSLLPPHCDCLQRDRGCLHLRRDRVAPAGPAWITINVTSDGRAMDLRADASTGLAFLVHVLTASGAALCV